MIDDEILVKIEIIINYLDNNANKVYMLENAVYSVISPEGCASILWKDSKRVEDAADCLHITAEDMKELQVAEDIFKENFNDFKKMCNTMKDSIYNDVTELMDKSISDVTSERYEKFRKIGFFEEM